MNLLLYITGVLLWKAAPGYCRERVSSLLGSPGNPGLVKRALSRAILEPLLREYYDDRTQTERREELKRLAMGGDGGLNWAVSYYSQAFPTEHFKSQKMWRWLEEALDSGNISKVHHVGCSSGREVGYHASRYPGVEFVGSDFDDRIIDFCREKWSHLPNVSFQKVDLAGLDEKAKRHLEAEAIVVSGVLNYLDGKTLRGFIKEGIFLTGRLFICEPLPSDFNVKGEKSRPRKLFAWAHPYITYLEGAGWEVTRHAMGPPAELKDGVESISIMAENLR